MTSVPVKVPAKEETRSATIMAGVPAINGALVHRIRFVVGDPVALLEIPGDGGRRESTLILRDIEMARARHHARVDRVACPADFSPDGGLSGDRETATAQAAAECLRRAGVRSVVGDRSLPLCFIHELGRADIAIEYDPDMGVATRRTKDSQEIEWLREAQRVTEEVMQQACRLVATARADSDGVLSVDGDPLTSERVRATIDHWLLDRGFSNPVTIVAGGPAGADCHDKGTGPLRTGEPVIIDIFPKNRETLYNGDCTRTVVHGEIPAEVARMHAAVIDAKADAIAAVRAGVTGQQVHAATTKALTRHGYTMERPNEDRPDSFCAMTHGTGHGIGLDVHEPPLLDDGGPALVVGDALTVEPGLYCRAIGGVRVEDMIIVTETGHENLNQLPQGLDWT